MNAAQAAGPSSVPPPHMPPPERPGAGPTPTGRPSLAAQIVLVVALAMSFLYSPLMTSLFGGTVGKLTCGLRVVRLTDGRRLSYGPALGRHLAHSVMGMVPVLGHIDALFCLWDRPFRQCLHDKTVGSVVIRSRMRPPQAPRP
ncbi:RDD family protein [Streptomyces sp. NPDC048197]|uniref:RDD family protein n=1 Tax=Streptomyces sp. NPDC048197 TaxID=3365511 RepID=UPI00371A9C96